MKDLARISLLLLLSSPSVGSAGAISTLESDGQKECIPRPDELQGPEFYADRTLLPLTRDVSCYISPRELTRWRRDERLVIIDLRPSADFRRVRIPGSINLSPRTVRARPYLRSRMVLLVDRGHLGETLERTCRELLNEGFGSIGILEGGLGAWAQHVGDLEGDRIALRTLNRIPAREFAIASGYDHWLVIDVSREVTPDLTSLVPRAVRVARGADDAAFRRQLLDVIQGRQRRQQILFVAVVDRDGRRYEGIERAVHAIGVAHVFFLEGGLNAYREFRNERRALLAQAPTAGTPFCSAP